MQGARSDGTILHPVPSDSPAQLLTLSTYRENQISQVVAGQNHGFLCLLKPNRAYGDRVWRNRFIFFFSADGEENIVDSCLGDCSSLHEGLI